LSGQSGVRVSKRKTIISEKEKPQFFDIRGRKIISGVKFSSGLHLMYNKNAKKINLSLNTKHKQVTN
jgi:hypothetical protein